MVEPYKAIITVPLEALLKNKDIQTELQAILNNRQGKNIREEIMRLDKKYYGSGK